MTFEREREGLRGSVWKATHLERGQSTLHETLAGLGSPDLILKVGNWTRLYYTYWDSNFFRLILRAALPLTGAFRQLDAINIALGEETLELARLDFDEHGILAMPPQVGVIPRDASGFYVAIDSNLVRFLEDRKRSLRIQEDQREETEESSFDTEER